MNEPESDGGRSRLDKWLIGAVFVWAATGATAIFLSVVLTVRVLLLLPLGETAGRAVFGCLWLGAGLWALRAAYRRWRRKQGGHSFGWNLLPKLGVEAFLAVFGLVNVGLAGMHFLSPYWVRVWLERLTEVTTGFVLFPMLLGSPIMLAQFLLRDFREQTWGSLIFGLGLVSFMGLFGLVLGVGGLMEASEKDALGKVWLIYGGVSVVVTTLLFKSLLKDIEKPQNMVFQKARKLAATRPKRRQKQK